MGVEVGVEVGVTVDLNADVGEVDDPADLETALLEIVTSANIATGAHAGNPAVMDAAVRFAARTGVAVGAHPSYPDRGGFGRRVVEMSPDALQADLLAQVRALDTIARSRGVQISHVKPHGALYHQAIVDDDCAALLAGVVAEFAGVALVVPTGAPAPRADRAGIRIIHEAFADRGYLPDGTLVVRGQPGDLLTDPGAAAAQAVSIALDRRVRATDGSWLAVQAETLCLHGDTPGAAAIGAAVRSALEGAGVRITAPS